MKEHGKKLTRYSKRRRRMRSRFITILVIIFAAIGGALYGPFPYSCRAGGSRSGIYDA